MLPEAIELIVVTPERELLRESVVEVTIPGLDGAFGILPGHAPMITELGIGEMSYHTTTSRQPVLLAIERGFAEVLPDRVTVLAETGERAEEIDLERAQAAKSRAEQRLASQDANVDWDRAAVGLQRALIRIQVARKYRGVAVESR